MSDHQERLRRIADQCDEFADMVLKGTYNKDDGFMLSDLYYLRDLARGVLSGGPCTDPECAVDAALRGDPLAPLWALADRLRAEGDDLTARRAYPSGVAYRHAANRIRNALRTIKDAL